MALALPKLDNRTYDELVREGQRILPRRAPQWSDHNAHDPGITLIELFSWLVEQDIYRLDRTPDASIRAFLRFTGIVPRPPQVAATVVELAPSPGGGAVDLQAGLVLTDEAAAIRFETDSEIHVIEARLVAVESRTSAARSDHRGANAPDGKTYLPFGPGPEANDALLLGFDAPLGHGGETVTLYAWGEDPETDADTRRRLIAEWQRSQREVEAACGAHADPTGHDWRRHYSVQTAWEYPTAAGTWAPLDGVDDETRGLSLSGFVRFNAPADHAAGAIAPGIWSVRCRIVSGRYECPPAIDRIAVNAVNARHAALMPEHTVGLSQGHAGETFPLGYGPAVAASVQLRVARDGNEGEGWHEVAEWDRVGPHDRAFRLDPARAQLSFGDGRIGRVLPAGATVACRYRVGGGTEGNVAAGTLRDAQHASIDVRQPFPAFGGAAAESLAAARGRALAFLAERCRAITLTDLETLALATPGVPVTRARALAGHHPLLPCISAAGCVTVVAVPYCPGDRPHAGPDFLAAIYRWLIPRCALSTELHVVGPSYVAIGVRARLHAESRVDIDRVAADAQAELERFFHPFEGGPDGNGWPAGRAVYRSEVMAILNAVAGVAFLDRLSLVAEGSADASCANVMLCPSELAAAGKHDIQVIARRQVR